MAIEKGAFWSHSTTVANFTYLSEHTANLRSLLKKGNEYIWTSNHEKAFQRIKALIDKELTLAYFDPTQPMAIQDGISSRGLRAALL